MIKKELSYEEKLLDMGRKTTALLNLHLKHPEKWSKEKVMGTLLDEFERMELEDQGD